MGVLDGLPPRTDDPEVMKAYRRWRGAPSGKAMTRRREYEAAKNASLAKQIGAQPAPRSVQP